MKKLLPIFLLLVLFSCLDNETVYHTSSQDPAISEGGRQYDLDPLRIYCGPGWGRKFCFFLSNYDGTIWADTENYYSEFSDIRFSNFSDGPYFISFFNLDSVTSYCEGWKLGETISDGIKWNIEFKKDVEDVLSFRYDYYGTSKEIEYSTNYRYEVIDGLLHFSRGDQTFIFHPSEKNYSKDSLDTDEIVVLDGCLFY